MLKNFFKKKAISKKKGREVVGLDIGNFNVKAAQLKKDGDKFNLSGLGFCRVNSKDRKDVIEAIKKTVDEVKITTKKINASIFPEGVIVRYLLLPNMSTEELNKAMNFEIERYVPFKKEEVVSDYLILGEDTSKKNMKVLLVAAKQEFVDNRVSLIRDAGLEPELITIDSLVLRNCFRLNYPDKKDTTVGLLNMGSKLTNINIVRSDFSYFMRDVQIGGSNITYLIKEKLGINEAEAESMKCNLNAEKNQEIIKVIEPVLGNLLNEIYLSFDYYESEFGLVVDEIYISGGASNLSFIKEFLKENLGREIFQLDSRKNLILESDISPQKTESLFSFLPVCIGLALESFL